MPSLARVNAPAAEFASGAEEPGDLSLMDLAYSEWCDRDQHSACNAHVEEFFAWLARSYPNRRSFV